LPPPTIIRAYLRCGVGLPGCACVSGTLHST